jgi:Tol biopolymer transport system component
MLSMTGQLNRVLVAALLLAAVGVEARQGAEPRTAAGSREGEFLSRVRRLTVEGRRAGEGYWSPDGQRLVFQSEREAGNPFYQIYALDFASGDTKRISPGYGKTTCSFFRPGSDQILFASTHHDPRSKALQQEEIDFRASGNGTMTRSSSCTPSPRSRDRRHV